MDVTELLLDQSKKILLKKYRHFDHNLSNNSAKKFIVNVVTNKDEVSKYRFFPFIEYYQNKYVYHAPRNDSKG
ncbi:hypothetical protein, partial [Lactobacillus sp. Sy-1]|uniref:hypothetical protein n=1 Tax=Lactobacillus sp. Sy-1 TaxID=2109645 RepID=UPI001C5B6071